MKKKTLSTSPPLF